MSGLNLKFSQEDSNCVALYSDPLPDIEWINLGATGAFNDYDGLGQIKNVNDENLQYKCYKFVEKNDETKNIPLIVGLCIFGIFVLVFFKRKNIEEEVENEETQPLTTFFYI